MLSSSLRNYRQWLKTFRSGAARTVEQDELSTPRKDTPPSGDPTRRKGYTRQYVRWLWPFRRAIVGIFTLAVIAAAMSLVLPLATKFAVDEILLKAGPTGGETVTGLARYLGRFDARTQLHLFGGAMLALLIVQQAIYLLRQWWMAVVNARIVVRLRRRLYWHLLNLPLTDLADLKSGRIVSRLSGDMDQITGLLQIAVITPGVALIKVVLTLAMLLYINWKMALVATLLLPPLTIMNLLWVRRIRPIYRALRKDRADIDGRVTETFGGVRVVRAFARERSEMRGYVVQQHTVTRKALLARRYELMVALGWGLLIPLISLLVIWYGGLRMLAGDVTIGGIMAFQMYIMMLLEPVSVIVHSYGETQQALAAMERVFDLLARPVDKPDRPNAVEAPREVREIVFEEVHFGYRAELPVVRGISLRVDAGQTIALVGPSGAGKTTLTHLVARFYDPTRGAIRLNGIDLRDIRLRSYRRLLAYVPQDVFLFDGTVSENIAFGRRNATPAQIERAARRANAEEFIRRLPEGYDTLVGERGVKLSGGQAQRISIARAFLADPQILILDEATSNLDTQSEELIQAGMAELIVGRTTFIIAHRLSTVMHADQIVVIEDGVITELGAHGELMARGERYREMVERQIRPQSAEAAAWLT
ncbi:MAG: ABC transporter ATP-binding protein [Phycisphaerae bacterium]|nr:ABC transporter ATP-binding protein/permease [Phycisphaerae bacterium]NUQ46059.1 ABC transporter ATP-binding protein [Phycisphaerae bacterium]